MKFTGERFIPDSGLTPEIETEHLQRYFAIQDLVQGKVVLDAASGAGYGTDILARQAARAFGLEIDSEAVRYSQNKYPRSNLYYLQGSIDNIPLPDQSVDIVVSFETIEHVDEETQQSFLLEIKRVLKHDGLLIMSSPDKRIYSDIPKYRNEFHVKEFYRDEFREFLHKQFTHVVLLDQAQELAYILTDNRTETYTALQTDDSCPIEGKYIIALCSESVPPDSARLNTIHIDSEKKYQKKTARILELQEEIIEKNGHIDHAWGIVKARDTTVEKMTETIVSNEARIKGKDSILKEKNLEITEKDAMINTLSRDLTQKNQQLETLTKQLQQIQSTLGWKLLGFLKKIKKKIRP